MLAIAWSPAEGASNVLPADDKKVLYVGRADLAAPDGPRIEWAASELRLRFRGTFLSADLTDTGKNRFSIIVDDAPPIAIGTTDTRSTVKLASRLTDAEHTVRIIKNTGAFGGIVQFHQFLTSPGGEFLKAVPRKHRIEVIGDSISTGAGDEGDQPSDRVTVHNSNAELAYGSIAADLLNADYTCVAMFGKQMAQRNTLPEIYNRTLPSVPGQAWDFKRNVPDVVVINLSTNDFYNGTFKADEFAAAYEAFLIRLHNHYPGATIYMTDSPLLTENQPSEDRDRDALRQLLDRIHHAAAAAGVSNLHVFYFDPIPKSDGLGAGWHPTTLTQAKMGAKLAERIATDMKWGDGQAK